MGQADASAQPPRPAVPAVRVLPGLREEEVVRLTVQMLYSLGYTDSARTLERESGFVLETSTVSEFRGHALSGNWDAAVAVLPQLGVGEEHIDTVKFLVAQQKFLELLEDGKVNEALIVLRTELTPLQRDARVLLKLSSLLMCASPAEVRVQAQWDGKAGTSRQRLLADVQKFLPSSLMIPDRRMEHLLQQALDAQRSNCLYHNNPQPLSLYEDHACGRSALPGRTALVLAGHSDEVWYVAFAHRSLRLASASKDRTVILWDAQSGVLLHRLAEHSEPVSFVAWSPNDALLTSCSNDRTICLWDTATGTRRHTFTRHTESVTSCAWLPDSERFVSGCQDKNIFVWHISGQLLHTIQGTRVLDLAVCNRGSLIVTICQEKRIRIYPMMQNVCEAVLSESEAITSLSVSQDGRYAAINLSAGAQQIHVWDLVERRRVASLSGHKQAQFIIRSTFGGLNDNFVISGSEDNSVYIWNWRKGVLLAELKGHTSTVNSVAWSAADPTCCASASDDTTVRVWRPETAE